VPLAPVRQPLRVGFQLLGIHREHARIATTVATVPRQRFLGRARFGIRLVHQTSSLAPRKASRGVGGEQPGLCPGESRRPRLASSGAQPDQGPVPERRLAGPGIRCSCSSLPRRDTPPCKQLRKRMSHRMR
jgi:hypothetical protein